MRVKIFALCVLLLTIGSVIVNTLFVVRSIDRISGKVSSFEPTDTDALLYAKEIEADFKRKLTFISLTVNHDDLTNIELSFAELIGYLEVGDTDEASVTKNRLLNSLEHLGRLSGFGIDAII